jgi:hypothetical protein
MSAVAGQIQLVPPFDESLVSRLLLRMRDDAAGHSGNESEMPSLLPAELDERKQWCWWWCE